MSKSYFLPAPFFDEIKAFAEKEGFPEVLKVVSKHQDGDIILESWEVGLLLNVATIWRCEAELKFPFWDPNNPNYDPEHEEGFFDAQEDHFGKILATFSDLGE
ncbi:MAG: hypothetical protein LAT63_09205 [Marinobacter sp.]|nr:hypothetical protein [Marinobacter sp.]